MVIEIAEIGQISELVTSGSRGWAAYYADSGALFLRMTNLPKDGIKLLLDDKKYVQLPEGSNEGKRTAVRDGDILISITAELGKIGFVEGFANKEAYVNQRICLIRPIPSEVNPKFLAYYLSSPSQRYLLNSLNDSGAKSGLNLSTIAKFRIHLPDINLQEHAVYFLEYWESAIEKTEALISAKERQFRWFCNSLIKKALPEDGKKVPLSDIYEFKRGSGLSKDDIIIGGRNKCILYGQLYTTYGEVIDEVIDEVIGLTNKKCGTISKYGDILMPASTTTSAIDLANATALLEDDILLGGDINILRSKSNQVDSEFMAYYLTHYKKHDLARLAQGVTIMHLYGKDIKSISVCLPNISAQQDIANALNVAQQEINLLKKLLAKYHQQKRGLMQTLIL